ncbi:GNAT family N-acetyltransferase [Rhizobium helianthi]|uniref:GNAT family N-acetyltransferase n=1 Tax=Rhizobium helianthi TaxID=1132695 RepID=A0ABW4M7V3_9HYPH
MATETALHPNVTIREIAAQDTLDIRQAVLWPDRQRADLILAEDAEGTYFGAFMGDDLIGVISLFRTPDGVRFRKFATLASWQGKGIGSALLLHSLAWARSIGATRIWCDARVSAAPFYARLGFTAKGDAFEKIGLLYTVMDRACE